MSPEVTVSGLGSERRRVPPSRCSGRPRDDVLLADRGYLLSLLTFPSENRHGVGHTGQLRAATLADMGRCRMGFC
jgi:hypothetical protein